MSNDRKSGNGKPQDSERRKGTKDGAFSEKWDKVEPVRDTLPPPQPNKEKK